MLNDPGPACQAPGHRVWRQGAVLGLLDPGRLAEGRRLALAKREEVAQGAQGGAAVGERGQQEQGIVEALQEGWLKVGAVGKCQGVCGLVAVFKEAKGKEALGPQSKEAVEGVGGGLG